MVKYLRGILSSLVVLLALAAPSAVAQAAQHDINYGNWIGYENEDGTLTITGCRAIEEYVSDRTLTIPTEVEGKRVTGLGFYLGESPFYIFDDTSFIETLIIPDTIVKVDKYQGDEYGRSIFGGYAGLKKVILPDNDTFSKEDAESLFEYNDASVKELTCWSESCIEVSTYGSNRLWQKSLETLSLHYVGGYFGSFPNLKTLAIRESEDADKKLTCYGLPALVSLTLPDGLKGLELCNCSLLSALSLPDGLKSLELDTCPMLSTVSLPESLNRMWLRECAELTELQSKKALKDISIERVYNCPKLSLPAVYVKYDESYGDRGYGITNGGYYGQPPFSGSKVQEIHIDSRRIVYGMDKAAFRGTPNLKAIVVEGNASNFFSKDGVLYWKSEGTTPDGRKIPANHLFAYPAAKSTSGNLNIPADVQCIYVYALDGCKFSTITFPENIHPYYEWDLFWESPPDGDWVGLADLCDAKFRMVKNSSPDDGYLPKNRLEYYKGSTYKITYNLSGGKNSSANPSSYTAGEEIAIKNPSRSGYTFLGWTRNDSENAADYWNTTEREDYGYFSNLTFTAHWMRITGASKKIAAGKSIKLTAEFVPAGSGNPSVNWSSSNEKVATVSGKGVVTFKKKTGGKSVTITAQTKGESSKKATFKLKSMKGIVKKIKLSGKKTLKVGKSMKLKAKVTASSGANKTLTWSSSNKKYADVSSKGKVTAKKAGKGKKVTITAKATDGSGKKGTFKITIK